jgi:hypothetical protein
VTAELVGTTVLALGAAWVAVQGGMLPLPNVLVLALGVLDPFPVVPSTGPMGWDRMPVPAALLRGGHGLVKVNGSAAGDAFESAVFVALGDGTHKLPIATRLLERISTGAGDEVTAHLTRRRAKRRRKNRFCIDADY